MDLSVTWVVDWIRMSATTITDNRAQLNTLDRDIGDGDHGENMDRGMQAAWERMSHAHEAPSDALRTVATTLISTIGGAAGPLYGTAFLRGAAAVEGKTQLDATDIANLLAAARDGIVERGKADPGDKTMVDAWTPAVQAAREAAQSGNDPAATLVAAAEAAETGVEATKPLVARKGRASYLGERAIGHPDPGAQSTALILRAAAVAAGEQHG